MDYDADSDAPVRHRVDILNAATWFDSHLGVSSARDMTPIDWLTTPEQALIEVTAGEVFHDDLNLAALRADLAYYPHDVRLYRMAAIWDRIGQEEHLAPRAGYVGDEIGSALIASRLVRDIMRLCFLMERCYAPYPKWFGTAFQQLDCAGDLSPVLQQVMHGQSWQSRETHLCTAYEMLAHKHNALHLTPEQDVSVRNFHSRPFKVLEAWRFSDALLEKITDPAVKQIASKTRIGGIDQFSDSTDLLEQTENRQRLRGLYAP